MKKLSNEELLVELEVPFPVDQVLWRVTNTANNRTRGQVVPYADPRAYTDRLNGLVTAQGWTRSYETTTMNNITRHKRNSEIVTGKILVVCKVTIEGLGTHSGTGEEWADEENAMTSAEAQAFKRACSCFGLGRCFYDFDAPWVDLDDKGRPKKAPAVPSWLIPENWRKGARPSGKAGGANGSATPSHSGWRKQRPRERQRIQRQWRRLGQTDFRFGRICRRQAVPMGSTGIRPCQQASPGARHPAEEEDSRRAGVGHAGPAPHGGRPRSHPGARGRCLAGEAASPATE